MNVVHNLGRYVNPLLSIHLPPKLTLAGQKLQDGGYKVHGHIARHFKDIGHLALTLVHILDPHGQADEEDHYQQFDKEQQHLSSNWLQALDNGKIHLRVHVANKLFVDVELLPKLTWCYSLKIHTFTTVFSSVSAKFGLFRSRDSM